MKWLIPLSFLIVFELIADIFSKEYSLVGSRSFWILAISGYIIANIFWLVAIRNGSGLARGAIIFSVGSAILAVLLGFLFFHEEVTKTEIIGVILGIASLIFIFW